MADLKYYFSWFANCHNINLIWKDCNVTTQNWRKQNLNVNTKSKNRLPTPLFGAPVCKAGTLQPKSCDFCSEGKNSNFQKLNKQSCLSYQPSINKIRNQHYRMKENDKE
uniref:Uncharacterized protein n=1 Tax=Oryza brachyantha TaxID=4533 RepID=J3MIW6_ORYBR